MVSEESIKEIFKKLGYQTSIGNHGLIFVTPIDKGNSFTKSFPNYQEAYIYYIEPNKMSAIVENIKTPAQRIENALAGITKKMDEISKLYDEALDSKHDYRVVGLSNEVNEHVSICLEEIADHVEKTTGLLIKEIDRLKEEALNG